MIPWATFDDGARNDIPDEVRIQLHEHWLPWVEHGPTMTTVYIETPMLEIAHERQFVVSQQGGDSSGFEADHTRRIDECLKQLDHHFHSYAINTYHRPSSPCGIDLKCCWMPQIPGNESPPLRMFHDQAKPAHHPDSPLVPPQPPVSVSSIRYSATPTTVLGPEADSEESDISESAMERMVLNIPRAGGTPSTYGARAQKEILQRRKYDSKLMTDIVPNEKKRSSQWMVDKHEDDIAIAMRTHSIASLRTGHDQHLRGAPLARILRHIEDP